MDISSLGDLHGRPILAAEYWLRRGIVLSEHLLFSGETPLRDVKHLLTSIVTTQVLFSSRLQIRQAYNGEDAYPGTLDLKSELEIALKICLACC